LHKENDSYLAAEGIFDEKDLIEDVHLRSRPLKGQAIDLTSTNANTFWQIEIDKDVTNGNIIAWDTNIRLKHLITRKYLHAHKGVVTLVAGDDKKKHKGTVFRFASLVKGGLYAEYGSYAKIEHPLSETFVHATKEEYKYRQYDDLARFGGAMAAVKWETNALTTVTMHPQVNFDDAFAIVPVEPEVINNFNFVIGVVPVLQEFINRYQGKKIQKLTAEEYRVKFCHPLSFLFFLLLMHVLRVCSLFPAL